MSNELVWVASIGAGAALLGAAVSGLVTFFVTKRQADAQIDGLKLQLRATAEESRRGRLVDARKARLEPVSNSLVKMIMALIAQQTYYSTMQSLLMAGGPILPELSQKISEAEAAAKTAADELNNQLGQISDKTLVELINQAWTSQIDSASETQSLQNAAASITSRIAARSIEGDAAVNEVKSWTEQMREWVGRRQAHYLSIS